MRSTILFLYLFASTLTPTLASLSCAAGFGSPRKSRVISEDRINDGYCDCPLDAADEPLTDACSGSVVGGWAGVSGTAEQRCVLSENWFLEGGDYHPAALSPRLSTTSLPMLLSPTITCPQQPNKNLPLSRLNDGICDCCDGADEPTSGVDCPDICEEVLAEERALRAKLEQDFAAGYAKRQEQLQTYRELVEKTKGEMNAIELQLRTVNDKLDEANTAMDDLKRKAAERRLDVVENFVTGTSEISSMFQSLSNDELSSFIVHSCQLAGEMEDAANDESTCVPLRLAGLDLGLAWGQEDYNTGEFNIEFLTETDQMLLANILDHNAREGEDPAWSADGVANSGGSPGRRRLDEYDEYPDEYDMYDDDYRYEEDEDDIEEVEPPSYSRRHLSHRHRRHMSAEETAKKKEMEDEILNASFSTWRKAFLNRAEELEALLNEIEEQQKEEVGAEVEVAAEEEAEGEEIEASTDAEEHRTSTSHPSVDPMAIPMIRSSISRRKEMIQKGLEFAASATLLVKAVAAGDGADQTRKQLLGLASMTLYHSKISTGELWKILAATVPQLNDDASSLNKESCASPLAAICPPRTVERNNVFLPPPTILQTAEAMCELAASGVAAKLCASDDEEIPSEIPDGYYGYYLIRPRTDADSLTRVFASLNSGDTNRPEISALENKIKDIDSNRKSLEKKLKDLEDDIGGKDGTKYGPNGELHYLRNDCLDVIAGKYIYEVCLFGKASQKEKGGHSSTSLGNWRGIEIDEATGDRLLKWENGLKCWNGPSRSATVHVTCGAETKMISAEEPDTCRYVLEMEAPFACDDGLKARLALYRPQAAWTRCLSSRQGPSIISRACTLL
jgi:hypothetical protein